MRGPSSGASRTVGEGAGWRQWAKRPLVGYLVLIGFQIKLFWHFWGGKDLPMGDETSYYLGARGFLEHGVLDLAWSPLYQIYYALVIRFFDDPYTASLSHRLVVILACSFLVYEISRRLLGAGWGLLLSVWWLVMPVNHEPLYVVHSFALAIVLFAWLVLLSGDSAWRRGSAMALLGLATALIRLELILVFSSFAVVVLCYEWRRSRAPMGGDRAPWHRLLPYVVPNLSALLVLARRWGCSPTST